MNTQIETLLLGSIKRTKRNFVIVIAVLLGLLALMIIGVFNDPLATPLVKGFVGLLCVGLAWLIYKMVQMVLKPNPILNLFKYNASAIKSVEALSIVTPRGKQTYQMNLHIKTSDGATHVLSDHRTKITELVTLLEKEYPNVSFVKKNLHNSSH